MARVHLDRALERIDVAPAVLEPPTAHARATEVLAALKRTEATLIERREEAMYGETKAVLDIKLRANRDTQTLVEYILKGA